MIRPRLIPALLYRNKGLVKTRKFKDFKYIGDPLNAVRIFNEKNVDELLFIDIDATKNNQEPDYELIRKISAECRMPLTYGGGIKNVKQIGKIISLGVEKVSLSSILFEKNNLIKHATDMVGKQSIVVTIDIKKTGILNKYKIFIKNGTINTKIDPIDFIYKLSDCEPGELLINFIDRDGERTGYDMDYVSKICNIIKIPFTVLGGARSLNDFKLLYNKFGIIGAAAGSVFTLKGKYNAVLINYPSNKEKKALYNGFKY